MLQRRRRSTPVDSYIGLAKRRTYRNNHETTGRKGSWQYTYGLPVRGHGLVADRQVGANTQLREYSKIRPRYDLALHNENTKSLGRDKVAPTQHDRNCGLGFQLLLNTYVSTNGSVCHFSPVSRTLNATVVRTWIL